MPLFGRKPGEPEKATESTREAAGQEPVVERLSRQLGEERRQRLEDVRKERAERLAAQEELGRMRKEYYRLLREVEELRLEVERARAARKGLFGSLFEDKQGEDGSDGR